ETRTTERKSGRASRGMAATTAFKAVEAARREPGGIETPALRFFRRGCSENGTRTRLGIVVRQSADPAKPLRVRSPPAAVGIEHDGVYQPIGLSASDFLYLNRFPSADWIAVTVRSRSEERRVGKECRYG